MIRIASLCAIAMSLLVLPSYAAQIAVTDNLDLEIALREGWTLHLDPPDALVREMASHVAHEPAAANASIVQIEQVTRKRLAANEAFVYHAASGAHLEIDFSPLQEGSSSPSLQTLRNSAEYAAQSLENEQDVAEMTWEVLPATLKGVENVYLLSAEYLQHDHPMTFWGYIGFVEQNWFFLYFTAPGNAPEVLHEMRSMFESMMIRSVSG